MGVAAAAVVLALDCAIHQDDRSDKCVALETRSEDT